VNAVTRYLEIAFGHKRLLLAPLLAALIATGAYVWLQPASYQSTTTLWASGGGNGTQSAAQVQVDIANQFLKTNSFAATVAQTSPLGQYLDSHRSQLSSSITGSIDSLVGRGSDSTPSAEAIRQYLASHVLVTTVGPSEFTVTVSSASPDVASGTASALAKQLGTAEVAARIAPSESQLAVYQSQLKDLQTHLDTDLASVRTYLAAHPNLNTNATAAANDAQLSELQAQATVDRQNYLALLGKIDQTESDIQVAQQPQLAPFRVVDAAQTPSAQAFLGKQQMLGIGAGVLAGLVLMAAMGALLARLDTTIHTPDEVGRMLGLRVIGSAPLSAKA
jgi:uncharacterized protein involved in exopolysaccharide biosynthesis